MDWAQRRHFPCNNIHEKTDKLTVRTLLYKRSVRCVGALLNRNCFGIFSHIRWQFLIRFTTKDALFFILIMHVFLNWNSEREFCSCSNGYTLYNFLWCLKLVRYTSFYFLEWQCTRSVCFNQQAFKSSKICSVFWN